jgi:selenocysteine lyase/cysteine desulfurase
MSLIEKRLLYLTDYLAEGLLSRGYTVLSAMQKPGERSGILIFRHPTRKTVNTRVSYEPRRDVRNQEEIRSKGLDRRGDDPWHAACLERLAGAGIVVSMREGSLRVSPHFYNTEEEIDLLLDVLP